MLLLPIAVFITEIRMKILFSRFKVYLRWFNNYRRQIDSKLSIGEQTNMALWRSLLDTCDWCVCFCEVFKIYNRIKTKVAVLWETLRSRVLGDWNGSLPHTEFWRLRWRLVPVAFVRWLWTRSMSRLPRERPHGMACENLCSHENIHEPPSSFIIPTLLMLRCSSGWITLTT